MSDSDSNQGRNITVSLDDPICCDSSSSHESDWTDTDSDTSSSMSSKDSAKSASRRVHFGQGTNSGESRANRGTSASASSRNDQVPTPQSPAATSNTNQQAAQQSQQNNAPANSVNPTSTVPGVQPFNSATPITSTGQPVFVHHTGQRNLNQYGYPAFAQGATFPGQQFASPSGYITGYPQQQQTFLTPIAAPVNNMAGYVQQPNTGIHFQPQVPDTTNGPYIHTYHPRHDAYGQPVLLQQCAVGAPVYLCQPSQVQALHQPTVQPVVYQMQAPPQAPTCHHTCYQYASVAHLIATLASEIRATKWS